MGNTKAYTGIGWVPFKHNLSLKFVEMKMRAESFLKEKEDERKKWDKWRWELSPSWKKWQRQMKGRSEINLFAQICETILSAFIEYFLQKL